MDALDQFLHHRRAKLREVETKCTRLSLAEWQYVRGVVLGEVELSLNLAGDRNVRRVQRLNVARNRSKERRLRQIPSQQRPRGRARPCRTPNQHLARVSEQCHIVGG